MKCRNCGANYRTMELACPYCGSENALGRIWKKNRSQAEMEYERVRKDTKKITNPYVWNRVLNRILLIVGIFFILVFAGCFAFFFGREFYLTKLRDTSKDFEILQEYYDDREFAQMDQYLNHYELFGVDGYYGYCQMAVIQHDYDEYISDRLAFLGLSEEKQQEDDYYLKYAIQYSFNVFNLNMGNYSKLDPMNEKIHKEYQNEILAFWKGTLGMNSDEINDLIEKDYVYSSDVEDLIKTIKEREAWK